MHGFQNYLTQFLSLGEDKCHLKHFLDRLKVKVTLEGHKNELFSPTATYVHGF